MAPDHLLDAIRESVQALRSLGLEYALIGGAAMPSWGHVRATRDLDLLVLVGPDAPGMVDRIAGAFRERGFASHPRADRHRLEDGLLLRAWFLLRPQPLSLRVDLLLIESGFHARVIARAMTTEIDGTEIRVATCEDLILLQCFAGRPIDRVDSTELVAINRKDLDVEYLEAAAAELGIQDRPWKSP